MADKSGLLRIPQADTCLTLSETRSNLITRGRKDAAGLLVRNAKSNYLAVANLDGKCGFIDKYGRFVINPVHHCAHSFSYGRARFSASPVSRETDTFLEGTYGYLDPSGKIVIQPQFRMAWDFSDGLARVEVNGNWGFIDESGALAIEPRFQSVRDFQDGLAAAKVDGKYGFIDRSGKLVIQPRFDEISAFSEGLASVWVKDVQDEAECSELHIIDKGGSIAYKWDDTSETFGDFVDGIARVKGPCNWGLCVCGAKEHGFSCESDYAYYVDRSGKPLNDKYAMRALSDFENGVGIVSLPVDSYHQPGRYLLGYIDRNGRIEIQNELPLKVCIENGYDLNEKEWDLIEEMGKSTEMLGFDKIYTFHDGLAQVHVNGKYGFINVRGEVVIDPVLARAAHFKNGMALVSDHDWRGKVGFIDKTGELVIPCQFDWAGDFEQITP